MKLILSKSFLAAPHEASEFDVPDVKAVMYLGDDYRAVSFYGITPARLHDAIGCPVQDAYRELEAAARGISADLYRRGAADHGRAGDADALTAALAALDKARQ